MFEYIIPFLSYILVGPLLKYFTSDVYFGYTFKVLVTFLLLLAFMKGYDLKFKFRFFSFLIGFIIFISWILLPFSFTNSEFVPPTSFFVFVKFFGAVFVAAFVEELFTRGFLIRLFVKARWERVKPGTFTWLSFIVTVLFFGFSHNMWVAGLVVGVILNLWYYRTKSVEQCIIAHGFANLLLFFYVLLTHIYTLW